MTLIIGFVLDLIFGDPTMLPHPIRAIGNGIAIGEHGIRRIFPKSKGGEFVGGMILSLLVISLSFLVPFCILWFLAGINPWIAFIVESFMCYQILATKSLKKESMKVYAALTKGDLEGARFAVSMIVGRDTKALSSEGVAKATVETIAENTADGIVAPMLFMAIGGAPLGMMYKAINTLDSMIGYKNDQYRHFGTFAAKLDDVANYLPARLSAMFMIIGAVIGGFDGRNAIRIFKRDRYNHASPNSAQTESVCAGALNIQLAGDAYYFGKLLKKKTIGDKGRPVGAEDIKQTNRLMYLTATVALLVSVLISLEISWLWGVM